MIKKAAVFGVLLATGIVSVTACGKKEDSKPVVETSISAGDTTDRNVASEAETEVESVTDESVADNNSNYTDREQFLTDRASTFINHIMDGNYEEAYKMTYEYATNSPFVSLDGFKHGIEDKRGTRNNVDMASDFRKIAGSKSDLGEPEILDGTVYYTIGDETYSITMVDLATDENYGCIILADTDIIWRNVPFRVMKGFKFAVDDIELEASEEDGDYNIYTIDALDVTSHTYEVSYGEHTNKYEGTYEEISDTNHLKESAVVLNLTPTDEEEAEITTALKDIIQGMFNDYIDSGMDIESLKKYTTDDVEGLDGTEAKLTGTNGINKDKHDIKILELEKRSIDLDDYPAYWIIGNGDIKCYFQLTKNYGDSVWDATKKNFGALTLRKMDDGTYKISDFNSDFGGGLYNFNQYHTDDF